MARSNKLNFTLRDLIWAGGLLISIGAHQAQLSFVKEDLAQFKLQYERDVVPRGEHLEMNKVMEERLAGIQAQLADIKAQLAEIKIKQR